MRYVTFCDRKRESGFEQLASGRSEDRRLHSWLERAIQDLKQDPCCGTKIPRRLWPQGYIRCFSLTNLWKYDLPGGWRLVYTIKSDDKMLVCIILEWFGHKEYERRFRY